jgi:hypothetical protein
MDLSTAIVKGKLRLCLTSVFSQMSNFKFEIDFIPRGA